MRSSRLSLPGGTSLNFPKRVRELLEAHPDGLPLHIERLLVVIDSLNEQIEQADAEIRWLDTNDKVCVLLMTMPGVGPVTALRFRTAVDVVERFGTAHEVQSYLGLTPGERSSSNIKRRTSITKAGAPKVRWALCQAAWCVYRRRQSDPMVQWAQQVAQRRGPKIAIVALMRKMAGILFAMWRDNKPYDPQKGAQVTAVAA